MIYEHKTMIYKLKKDTDFKVLEKYGFKSAISTRENRIWYIKEISQEPFNLIMVSPEGYLAILENDLIVNYKDFNVEKYFKELLDDNLIEEEQDEH